MLCKKCVLLAGCHAAAGSWQAAERKRVKEVNCAKMLENLFCSRQRAQELRKLLIQDGAEVVRIQEIHIVRLTERKRECVCEAARETDTERDGEVTR